MTEINLDELEKAAVAMTVADAQTTNHEIRRQP